MNRVLAIFNSSKPVRFSSQSKSKCVFQLTPSSNVMFDISRKFVCIADENCYYDNCRSGGYTEDGSVLVCPQDARTTMIGTYEMFYLYLQKAFQLFTTGNLS